MGGSKASGVVPPSLNVGGFGKRRSQPCPSQGSPHIPPLPAPTEQPATTAILRCYRAVCDHHRKKHKDWAGHERKEWRRKAAQCARERVVEGYETPQR